MILIKIIDRKANHQRKKKDTISEKLQNTSVRQEATASIVEQKPKETIILQESTSSDILVRFLIGFYSILYSYLVKTQKILFLSRLNKFTHAIPVKLDMEVCADYYLFM